MLPTRRPAAADAAACGRWRGGPRPL